MKDPCGPGKGNHELKGKGVPREEESEGSLKQTADLTYRKRIRHSSWMRGPVSLKSNTYTENLDVDATGISRKEQRLTQGSLKSCTAKVSDKRGERSTSGVSER